MKNTKLVKKSVYCEKVATSYKQGYAQQQFATVLQTAVGAAYQVKGRAQVFDILKIENETAASRLMVKMFDEYYFDYVICRSSDQEIVCVVELALSERIKNSKVRRLTRLQALLQHYCVSVGLPRLVVAQQRNYALGELIERFEAIIEVAESESLQTV